MHKYIICLITTLISSAPCFCQSKTIIDPDSLVVECDTPVNKNSHHLLITLVSSFTDSVVLSYDGKIIFSKKCITDEVLGLAADGATTIYPKTYSSLSIVCYWEKLKRQIKIPKGYSFLYIYKDGRKIEFFFTNKMRLFD